MTPKIESEGPEEYSKRLSDELAFLGNGKKFFSELGDTLSNIVGESSVINKQFTQTKQRIVEMRYAIADAIPGVYRLGGSMEDISSTIAEVAEASNRNVIANTKSIEKLYAANELLGEMGVKEIVNEFADVGIRFDKIGTSLEESINYVQSIGGNASQVMKKVLDYTDNLNKYNFANGVQGLTKMAAQASMLRFDMGQTFALAESALDPEKAVELSSAFQRLGVMSGTLSDPFQLMNQSINDPEGLQNSILEMSKQFTYFDEKTKTFKINPQGMLTLREIEKQTGLSAKELSKAGLAAAELDARLSEIKPSIKFSNEEDKQYLANIASMNEKGEYTVNLKNEKGDQYTKRLADVTQEEMDKLIKEQKTGPKTLEEIQKKQLTASENLESDVRAIKGAILGGIATSPTIMKTVDVLERGVTAVSGTASKPGEGIAEIGTVRKYSEDFMGSVTTLVKDLASGEVSMGDAMKTFAESQKGLFNNITDSLNKTGSELSANVNKALLAEGIDLNALVGKAKEEIKSTGDNASKVADDIVKSNKEKNEKISDTKQDKTKTEDKSKDEVLRKMVEEELNKNQPTKIPPVIIQQPKTEEEKNQRLSQTIEESNLNLSQNMKSSVDEMTKYSQSFSTMVNKVIDKKMDPKQMDEWLEQNKTELDKFGGNLYQKFSLFSQSVQAEMEKTSKTLSETSVKIDDEEEIINKPEKTTQEVSKILIEEKSKSSVTGESMITAKLMEELKDLKSPSVDAMNDYKMGFDNLVKKVVSGEESSQKLTEFIENNRKNTENFGSVFQKNMEDYAKDVTGKVKEDELRLSEINQIKKDIETGNGKTIKDLEEYFKKYPESIERLGLSIQKQDEVKESKSEEVSDYLVKSEGEKKSKFIEGNRAAEPLKAGQVEGGQSLTQIIQHKVDFGKITVDVNLTGNYSQLDTKTQQMVLDKVFNDPKFTGLFNMVKEMGGNQLKQTSQFQNNNKK